MVLGAGLLSGSGAVGYLATASRAVTSAGPVDTDPGVAIRRSRTSAAAPAAFRARSGLRSCGDVVLGQGDTIPVQAITCLSRSDRELAVASPTVEGDLIVTFYRTSRGTKGIQVFADTTRDRYDPGGWSRTRCATRTIDEHGVCV